MTDMVRKACQEEEEEVRKPHSSRGERLLVQLTRLMLLRRRTL